MTSLANIRKQALRGFTLVELLIVVIILAILAAIVVPQFGSTTDDSKAGALRANLATLRSAITLYKQQHGFYPGEKVAAPSTYTCGTGGTAGKDTAATDTLYSQLSYYTADDGSACTVKDNNFRYGPYIKGDAFPKDPITQKNTVVMLTAASSPKGGNLIMAEPTATELTNPTPGGWVYDSLTGQIVMNIASTSKTPSGVGPDGVALWKY